MCLDYLYFLVLNSTDITYKMVYLFSEDLYDLKLYNFSEVEKEKGHVHFVLLSRENFSSWK